MAYAIYLSPKVKKETVFWSDTFRAKMVKVLEFLAIDPFSGKKLELGIGNVYSVSFWPYRIIYTIDKKELVVLVIDADHRGHIGNY